MKKIADNYIGEISRALVKITYPELDDYEINMIAASKFRRDQARAAASAAISLAEVVEVLESLAAMANRQGAATLSTEPMLITLGLCRRAAYLLTKLEDKRS